MANDKVLKTVLALLILMALSTRDRENAVQAASLLAGVTRGLSQIGGNDSGVSVSASYEVFRSETLALPSTATTTSQGGWVAEPSSTGGQVDFVA